MKTHFYRLLALLMTAALLLLAAGCGSSAQSGTPAGQPDAAPAESEPSAPETPDAPDAAPEEAAEPAAPGMELEQYKEMAAKFAFFCDSVYFDYQGERGTVTILDIQVEEDTEAQCRIRVYYQEPELIEPNSWVAATDGYMIFAVDKATGQGRMECWEFLGVPGEYLEESVDQMFEAEFYSGFVYTLDDVYDFWTGRILYSADSTAEAPADVNAYWSANSLQ